MIPQHLRIRFDNLLEEARWKFHGGDFVGAADVILQAKNVADLARIEPDERAAS